jgi:hypothetical protein
MQVNEIDTKSAPNKWWAARDARMRNYANSTLYSEHQRIAAERMKLALELVYSAKAIYIAYGKTGISLKVDKPLVRNRRELSLLEQGWALVGICKRVSAQGVIYRLNVA